MIARIAVLLFALSAGGADAHDYWSDGKAIPDWVKASCCGPADAHHLRPEQVHRISDDYYSVDGYIRRIPVGQALPSQDGDYWIFYRDDGANGQSGRLLLLRADGLLISVEGLRSDRRPIRRPGRRRCRLRRERAFLRLPAGG